MVAKSQPYESTKALGVAANTPESRCRLPTVPGIQSSKVSLFRSAINRLVFPIFQSVFPPVVGGVVAGRDDGDSELEYALGVLLSQLLAIGVLPCTLHQSVSWLGLLIGYAVLHRLGLSLVDIRSVGGSVGLVLNESSVSRT